MENEPIVVQVFWWMYLAIVSILLLAHRHPVEFAVFLIVFLLFLFIFGFKLLESIAKRK